MTISDAGLNLIKGFEGLTLTAYQDQGGVWTVGYGHTGPDVHEGMSITAERAEELLREDVAKAEAALRWLVTVSITQGM